MRPAYTAEEIRVAEAPLLAALPPGTLMNRAATVLAARCAAVLGGTYGARVVVLAGSGDNGGDAILAGAKLAKRGARVDVVCVSSDGDVDERLFAGADLVIDGIVGIGGRAALRADAARLAEFANSSGAIVVAVDVPSGVDASTGEVAGVAVRADVTVTFGAAKAGLMVMPGAEYAGVIDAVDIGLTLPPPSVSALDAGDIAMLWPEPNATSDKYSRGVVGVVAGSTQYPGAAVLAVGGAIAAGAGMVRCKNEVVQARWAEAVAADGRVQAWVVGPGLGDDEAAVEKVLSTDLPAVVDADALTVLSGHPEWVKGRANTLLTPHAGELARLRGCERDEVTARALDAVRATAAELGVTVLLKGSTTLVAQPDGQTRVNTASTPWLATAGSGDVLSGVCGTLLAAGLTPLDAGSVGAFVHGFAGVLAAGVPAAPIAAGDIVRHLPDAIRRLRD